MDNRKIVEKSCLLQDIFNESTRLQPLLLTLIDDFESNLPRAAFLGAFLNRLGSKSKPYRIDLLLLGTEQMRFCRATNLQMNANIRIFHENSLDLSNPDTIVDELISRTKSNSTNQVLIIDSINPLGLMYDNEDSDEVEKPLCRWIHKLTSHYQQMVITYHSDKCLEQDSVELGLSHISNVTIDFRHQLKKLQSDSCYSCVVKAKKKHPRTHFKVECKHEHFRLVNGGDIEFIDQESLKLKEKDAEQEKIQQSIPQSSFRLALSKQEQEAKESLVLPYIKNESAGEKEQNVSNIIYTYDKFDDYDDEDPDEDLDF